MPIRVTPLLLLLLFFYSKYTYSKNRNYEVVNYNTDNGLPQNSITDIHFDRMGYCWLGTEMGIVRFDGTRFRVFSSKNISGSRSERVRAIGDDSHKNTYVLMRNGQLITTEMHQHIYAPQPRLLKNSNTWLSSRNQFAVVESSRSKIADSLLSSLKYSGVEQLPVATPGGSVYLIIQNKTYYAGKSNLEIIDTQSRIYDKNHAIIDDRLVIIQPGGRIKSWLGAKQQKQSDIIYGPIQKDPDYLKEAYELITSSTGTYIYAGKTIYQLYFENNRFKSKVVLQDIDIKNLSAIYYNKEQGKYYIGSLTSGLYVIAPSLFQYPQMPEQAIKDGFRTQIAVEGSASIVCERYLYRKTNYVILPISRHIGATVFADGDHIYYGATANLFKFNLKKPSNRKLFELDSRPSGIIRDKADSNCIILSTSLSIGKMYHDTLKVMHRVPGRKTGSEILGLAQIGKDTFLLSTQEGLKWYDFRNNRIYRSILDSMSIHSLYTDAANHMWISTYGNGFFLYANNKITSLPLGPSDALRSVHAFVEDSKGNFWLPTNNGLYKARKESLLAYAEGKTSEVYYYAFSTQNGLHTNEFNGGSIPNFVWLKDSMLSLLSLQGPVWFYPNKVPLSLPNKGIYIEHIRVNQSEMELKEGRLLLAPDHGRISINVSSPYFGNKENMQLRFKIEGLDEEWHVVPESGDIVIERLPAGTFSLLVTKATGLDSGEYIRIKLPVQVQPYWYHTRLFYLCLLLLSVIFVYWMVKLRTRWLLTRNRKLETQVALQTEDLNRMVLQLTQSEEVLRQSNQTKDNIITTVLHDLRSPLRFIYMISKHVASGHRNMQQDMLDMHLQELKSSSASLNNFTDQFFTWALTQHNSFAARYSREALDQIFQEIERLYADIMNANGNQLSVVPTGLYCYTDPQLLSIIIRNLLDNANKYTRQGKINLAAARCEDKVIITISDTGRGFEPDALAAFLNKDKTDPRNGKGSFIILSLLELIGGRLEAISERGKGTEFTIILLHQN